MQQTILRKLRALIEKRELTAGERLPAERQLAEELGISRTSLRRVLHILEGQGLVTIRQGSGTSLNPRFFLNIAGTTSMAAATPQKRTADQLEAAFLALPVMVQLAALRLDGEQIEKLQKINVSLSRSMFSGDSHQVWKQSLAFFQRIAQGTGNAFMVTIMEAICAVELSPFDRFFEADRITREQVFAGHVKILNALRAKDARTAAQATRIYVTQLIRMVEADGTAVDWAALNTFDKEAR